MNRVTEFLQARYENVSWDDVEWDMNEVFESPGELLHIGAENFVEDYNAWEDAGFPPLNEYLTPADGSVREKQ